jgi:hypothetical protein
MGPFAWQLRRYFGWPTCCIGESDAQGENHSLVGYREVFYRSFAGSARRSPTGGTMNTPSISRQGHESSTIRNPPVVTSRPRVPAASELTLNPLWVVIFAAGMLFGMLAVLLTAG